MDVFVRNVGGSIVDATAGAFGAVGGALRGAVNEVLTYIPLPIAGLLAATVALAVFWRFAK